MRPQASHKSVVGKTHGAPGTQKRRKRLRAIVPAFWGLGITVALWWCGEYIGERTWPTLLIAYAPPILLGIPILPFLALTLLRRDGWALSINLLTIVFAVFIGMGLHLYRRAESDKGTPLRIMSYNIEGGSKGVMGVAQEIEKAKPDVVCLQETRGDAHHPDPIPALKTALPEYQFVRAGEVAIATRLPIQRSWPVPIVAGNRRMALAAEILNGGKAVTVLNAHLVTAAHPESLTTHRDSLPAYLHKTAAIRKSQIERLLEAAHAIQTPLILCGDFNTPPRGLYYRELTRFFRDSFAESGRGFGWSFPSNRPCLRIDYVFVREGILPVRTMVPETVASDHRPIVAELRVLEKEETEE